VNKPELQDGQVFVKNILASMLKLLARLELHTFRVTVPAAAMLIDL
jgi:hypothetical protein